MTGKLILLTGATGHVGYATLIEALSKGYHVRAAVRSEAKATVIKSAKSTQPYLSQLSFIVVPVIEENGAFDEAVRGVDFIVHLASPIVDAGMDDPEKDLIIPAIKGTLSILESALKEPKIKRIVITASVASVRPESGERFTADHIVPDPTGPYPNAFAAYVASKVLAYNRTRDFIAEQQPHFTIINIMPTFVIGKNELATTTKNIVAGSNALAMSTLLGQDVAPQMSGSVCHVDDVAYVHIASLNPRIEGNRNFGVNLNFFGTHHWDDAVQIVKKHYPDAVKEGIFTFGGKGACKAAHFDTTATEEAFGFKHKGYESMILSLAGHYIDVARKEQKAQAGRSL